CAAHHDLHSFPTTTLFRSTNIEVRLGSLFEAVAGERFDLITCNPPYVISPENRWAYRDSGLQGDEISRRVMLAAADHLAEGGFRSEEHTSELQSPDHLVCR